MFFILLGCASSLGCFVSSGLGVGGSSLMLEVIISGMITPFQWILLDLLVHISNHVKQTGSMHKKKDAKSIVYAWSFAHSIFSILRQGLQYITIYLKMSLSIYETAITVSERSLLIYVPHINCT